MKKATTISIAVIISFLVLPFCYLYPSLIRQGQALAMLAFALIIVSAQARNIWIKSFGIYLACWYLFALIFITINSSVLGMRQVDAIAQTIGSVVVTAITGLVIYVAVTRSKTSIDRWFDVICIAAFVQAAIGLLQIFGIYPYEYLLSLFDLGVVITNLQVIGTLDCRNFYAAFLAISLPFFFRPVRRECLIRLWKPRKSIALPYRWIYALPVILIALWHAMTTTAFVAAAAGTLVFLAASYGWKRKATWIVGSLIIALAFYYAFSVHSILTNDRVELWKTAIGNYQLVWQNLIFGHGPGVNSGRNYSLHNEYLQVFFEYGLVGAFLVVGFVMTAYRGSKILFASFVTIAVNCIGNFPLHVATTGFLIMIVLALMEREEAGEDAKARYLLKE